MTRYLVKSRLAGMHKQKWWQSPQAAMCMYKARYTAGELSQALCLQWSELSRARESQHLYSIRTADDQELYQMTISGKVGGLLESN